MSVVLVSDSAADFAPNDAAMLGIDLVPSFIRFDSLEYLDGVTITSDEFYRQCETSTASPSSAPPSPEAFEAAFRSKLNHASDIICIVISAKISKTYENAKIGAAPFDGHVHVVDSKTISGGEALLITGAAEMARMGADIATIRNAIDRWMTSQQGFAAFPRFDVLARTGRIDKSQILLGTMMHLFPIIRFDQDGTMHSHATVKSFDLAVELIIDTAVRKIRRKADARIAITHMGVPQLADRVATEVRAKLGTQSRELTIRKAGPAIATNLGLGAICIHSLEV